MKNSQKYVWFEMNGTRSGITRTPGNREDGVLATDIWAGEAMPTEQDVERYVYATDLFEDKEHYITFALYKSDVENREDADFRYSASVWPEKWVQDEDGELTAVDFGVYYEELLKSALATRTEILKELGLL